MLCVPSALHGISTSVIGSSDGSGPVDPVFGAFVPADTSLKPELSVFEVSVTGATFATLTVPNCSSALGIFSETNVGSDKGLFPAAKSVCGMANTYSVAKAVLLPS